MKLFDRSTVSADFGASIVVFLVALPLCLGIAIASGAPPAAGLITGMIGGIIIGFLAGSPLQVSGPAAGLAVLCYQLVQEHGFPMLGIMVAAAGALQLAAGAVRLGQVFRAIAPSVIYGMLAGIGVLIFAAQFHVMVDDQPRSGGLQNLISIPESVVKGLVPQDGTAHHWAALIGTITIVVLLLWSKFAPGRLRIIPGALVAVTVATAISAIAQLPIRTVELPDSMLTAFVWPAWASLPSLLQPKMLVDVFTIAFVASAETLLCAAAVDQMHSGPRTNYDRELAAQGVGNLLSGLAGGLPMTGVIVRSSANVQAGAKTRLSAILHGVWIVGLVALFPVVLRMVPTASLAAILVYTGYKLVSPQSIRRLATYGPLPVVVYGVTLAMIVITDLLTGILVGLGLSLVKLVYALTHMGVRTVWDKTANRVDVYFNGAATFVRLPKFIDSLEAVPADAEAHIHFQNLDYIDHACVDSLRAWEKQRAEKGQTVVVEWNELMAMYRNRNQIKPGPQQAPEPDSAVAA